MSHQGGGRMRSIAKLGAACTFAVLLLMPSLVFAQATITGTVKDSSGAWRIDGM